MKKKIFIGFVLGFVSNIFGQGHVNYPQDGVYGGFESGAAYVKVNGTFAGENRAIDDKEFLSEEFTKSVVSLNLGYGYYIGESLIAIEGHHSLYTKKISESFIQGDLNFDIDIASKSEIDLVIGRKIGIKSLITLRGGIAFSNINVNVGDGLGNDVYTLDNRWSGFSIGSGYVYGINENLSLKSKYNLTFFNNNKFPDTYTKFVDNRATLSLIYRIWSQD